MEEPTQTVQLGECNVRQREDLLREIAELREEVERLNSLLRAACDSAELRKQTIEQQRAELARLREEKKRLLTLIPDEFRLRVEDYGEPKDDTASLAASIGMQTGTIERLRATNAELVEARRSLTDMAARFVRLYYDTRQHDQYVNQKSFNAWNDEMHSVICMARAALAAAKEAQP